MQHTIVSLLSLLTIAAAYTIPKPPGPYGVSVGVAGLTDTSRLDPYAPTRQHRSVMISAFYPVAEAASCDWTLIHAYPKKTAQVFDAEVAFAGVPDGSLEKMKLQICETSTAQRYAGPAPIVLFSPGLGLSRLWYSALAQAVASYGFTVITIDHPYDADIVQFPDGRMIYAINSTWDQQQSEQDVRVRTKDMSFVLTELSSPSVLKTLFGSSTPPLHWDTQRAGIYGHSMGGATAASAELADPRFVGGVNLDGGLYGPVIHEGLENPFMLFGHLSNETSPTWAKIWPHLNWKLDIEILNSTHTTFTDIPLLAELIFGNPLPPFVQGIVGNVEGVRARNVVVAYVAAFMGWVLKCDESGLLDGPSAEYPEIVFEKRPGK